MTKKRLVIFGALAVLSIAVATGVVHAIGETWDGDAGGEGVVLTTDVAGIASFDILDMKGGTDWILFSHGQGLLWFGDDSNVWDLNNDWIFYADNPGTTDDHLLVKADKVTIMANSGDVVIQLGF